MERQLIRREYLGEGYLHFFENEKGEEKVVECSKEEYEALALPNPTNPTLKGYTWKASAGGTIKVDTPDTLLGPDEYCIKDDKVVAHLADKPVNDTIQFLSLDAVDETGRLDETKAK